MVVIKWFDEIFDENKLNVLNYISCSYEILKVDEIVSVY